MIVEIRDYRRCGRGDDSKEVHHILLRPSPQTLVADLNSICNNSGGIHIWTQEDKYSLESQLLLATQPSLCLDPNPRVTLSRCAFTQQSTLQSDQRVRRFALRYTEAYQRRANNRWHEYLLPYPFKIVKTRREQQKQQLQQQSVSCCNGTSDGASFSYHNINRLSNARLFANLFTSQVSVLI